GLRMEPLELRARFAEVDDARAHLAPLTRERATADVAEAPPDRRHRVYVDHEQRLLEPRRTRHELALVGDQDGVAVEDQLVLAADRVAERDEARIVARTHAQHLLALAVLADVERRGGDVRDELGAGECEVGGRRAGLPDVLADRRADERLA